MDLIPSFQVDHTKIVPGIYESRVDAIGGGFATMSDSLHPMNRSTPGLPVHHQLLEFTQTHRDEPRGWCHMQNDPDFPVRS